MDDEAKAETGADAVVDAEVEAEVEAEAEAEAGTWEESMAYGALMPGQVYAMPAHEPRLGTYLRAAFRACMRIVALPRHRKHIVITGLRLILSTMVQFYPTSTPVNRVDGLLASFPRQYASLAEYADALRMELATAALDAVTAVVDEWSSAWFQPVVCSVPHAGASVCVTVGRVTVVSIDVRKGFVLDLGREVRECAMAMGHEMLTVTCLVSGALSRLLRSYILDNGSASVASRERQDNSRFDERLLWMTIMAGNGHHRNLMLMAESCRAHVSSQRLSTWLNHHQPTVVLTTSLGNAQTQLRMQTKELLRLRSVVASPPASPQAPPKAPTTVASVATQAEDTTLAAENQRLRALLKVERAHVASLQKQVSTNKARVASLEAELGSAVKTKNKLIGRVTELEGLVPVAKDVCSTGVQTETDTPRPCEPPQAAPVVVVVPPPAKQAGKQPSKRKKRKKGKKKKGAGAVGAGEGLGLDTELITVSSDIWSAKRKRVALKTQAHWTEYAEMLERSLDVSLSCCAAAPVATPVASDATPEHQALVKLQRMRLGVEAEHQTRDVAALRVTIENLKDAAWGLCSVVQDGVSGCLDTACLSLGHPAVGVARYVLEAMWMLCYAWVGPEFESTVNTETWNTVLQVMFEDHSGASSATTVRERSRSPSDADRILQKDHEARMTWWVAAVRDQACRLVSEADASALATFRTQLSWFCTDTDYMLSAGIMFQFCPAFFRRDIVKMWTEDQLASMLHMTNGVMAAVNLCTLWQAAASVVEVRQDASGATSPPPMAQRSRSAGTGAAASPLGSPRRTKTPVPTPMRLSELAESLWRWCMLQRLETSMAQAPHDKPFAHTVHQTLVNDLATHMTATYGGLPPEVHPTTSPEEFASAKQLFEWVTPPRLRVKGKPVDHTAVRERLQAWVSHASVKRFEVVEALNAKFHVHGLAQRASVLTFANEHAYMRNPLEKYIRDIQAASGATSAEATLNGAEGKRVLQRLDKAVDVAMHTYAMATEDDVDPTLEPVTWDPSSMVFA